MGIPVCAEVNPLHDGARIHDAHPEVGEAVVARLGHGGGGGGGAPLFLGAVALRHPDQRPLQGDHLARIYVLDVMFEWFYGLICMIYTLFCI